MQSITKNPNQHLMNVVDRLGILVDDASGSSVHDALDDRWLLDFWGDEGVAPLGYNTKEMKEAMRIFEMSGQPHRLPEVYPNAMRSQAAAVVCDRTGMDKVFFCNSGTEANEAMIKLARRYQWVKEGSPMIDECRAKIAVRHHVLTVAGNFHGRTGFALASNDGRASPYHRHGYEPLARGFGVIDLIDGRWMEVYTNGMAHTPRDPDWNAVAAVNMAPVLGNNVVHTYSKEFWKAWAGIREKNPDVLLMFDDVQAGNGRAGYFANWQNPDIGVKPDIMCLGKGISLGWASAAMLARQDIAAAFTPGVHFNTFGGSMWTSAMTLYFYDWLDRNIEMVRRKGEGIRNRLREFKWIKHVDGSGMLNGFTPNYDGYSYNGHAFCEAARSHGLLLVTHRPFGPIRFTPPLNIDDSDLERAFSALAAAHDAVAM